MKVYYAHCKAIYGTKQELRDIALLEKLGYEVLNPNKPEHQARCQEYENPMDYFKELVLECEAVAFRGLPNGEIPCGVFTEVSIAYDNQIPVFELPVHIKLREMSLEKTRAYLTEIGER